MSLVYLSVEKGCGPCEFPLKCRQMLLRHRSNPILLFKFRLVGSPDLKGLETFETVASKCWKGQQHIVLEGTTQLNEADNGIELS